MVLINPATMFSALGSSSSLFPLLVKDSFASLGMTAGSCVTGKEEGIDRLIDEFGTEAVWLGTLPLYKLITDKTLFKYYGLDAKYDVRNLKDPNIFEATKKYAPNEEIKNAIVKIENNQGKFKRLTTVKFALTTVLAIASYVLLTKVKQSYTEKQITKQLIKEYNDELANKQTKDEIFKKFNKEQNNIQPNLIKDSKEKIDSTSFKSLASVAEKFIYNPARNMMIVDGAITTERLRDSRSWQEFFGYLIKESFALCFLYYAGGKIQNMLENHSVKKHNKNISLDSKVLENDYIKEVFANKKIEKSIQEYNQIKEGLNNKKDPLELYHFIHNNPDNAIVKIAKQSDAIKTLKNTDKIDTRGFIEPDKIEEIRNNLDNLYEQYKDAVKKGESHEEFFKKVKSLKRKSIISNIGISIFALGVVAPGIMLFKRFFIDKDSEFQTKKDIKAKLIKEGVIA